MSSTPVPIGCSHSHTFSLYGEEIFKAFQEAQDEIQGQLDVQLKKADSLPPSTRSLFIGAMKAAAQAAQEQLQELYHQRKSPDELWKAGKEGAGFVDMLAQQFFAGRAMYQERRSQAQMKTQQTDQNLRRWGMSFAPIQLSSSKMQLSKPEQEFGVSLKVIDQRVKGLNALKKAQSGSYRFSKFVLEDTDPSSPNAVRDGIFSGAVSLVLVSPFGKLATFKSFFDELGKEAAALEENLVHWANTQKGKQFTDIQIPCDDSSGDLQTGILAVRSVLELAQLPSALLNGARDVAVDFMAKECDQIGFTDENVQKVCKEHFDRFLESRRALFEQDGDIQF